MLELKKFYELNYSPNKPLVNLNYRLNNGSDAYVINNEMAKLLLTECNRTLTHSVDLHSNILYKNSYDV